MDPTTGNLFISIVFSLIGAVLLIVGIICLVVGFKKNSLGFKVGGLVATVKSFIFLFIGIINYFVYQIDN